MKVLLLGDYSSFHYNLAQGLKKLGVNVTLASQGDGWKNTPRDIDISNPENKTLYILKLLKLYKNLSGYDIVQFIAPNFLLSNPKLTSIYFDFLRLRNDKFFVCATGMDYYYINYALSGKLKYSVFYINEALEDPYVQKMKNIVNIIPQKDLETKIALKCNGIIATSIGYYKSFKNTFTDKTTFIPLPVDTSKYLYKNTLSRNTVKVNFLLGLMKERVKIKGTDRIHEVLLKLKKKYPNDIDLKIIDSLPYNQYVDIIDDSHVLCDQLYSYGLGMNGLLGMSKGLIVGGGADVEMYQTLGEYSNRPILDLNTSDKEMLKTFENLLENKRSLEEHALRSREFVVKHHDTVKVAQQYLDFWEGKQTQ